ncbi:MAG: hypothetical protein AAGC55_32045, partial [Myxococcota bacterium]
ASLQPEAPEVFEPLPFEGTILAMKRAARRGEVADAIVSFAVDMFDVVALCVVRDNMAFGWKAFGPGLDRERIETLLIPLDAPSMFQVAIHKDNQLFHAVPFPGTLHSYLYRVLRCQPPTMATAAVISIGKRVVNIMYGHRHGRAPLSEDELEQLHRVCVAAGNAYVRLIAASKRASTDSDSQPG